MQPEVKCSNTTNRPAGYKPTAIWYNYTTTHTRGNKYIHAQI